MPILGSRRILRGDHNQCPACSEYFNSTAAFEKHRAGEFGVDRRCKTVEEMLHCGMVKSVDDWWLTQYAPPREYGLLDVS